MENAITNAIEQQVIISFDYKGKERIIEPRLLGVNRKGNIQLVAYQVGGYSSNGEYFWRLYDLDQIENLNVSDSHFDANNLQRNEYNCNDSRMSEILAHV